MKMELASGRVIIWLLVITSADALCIFPSDLRGEWLSSKKGNITFIDSNLHGYHPCNIPSRCPALVPQFWQCWDNKGDAYVLRTSRFTDSGSTGRAYMCLYLIRLSKIKYLIYQGPGNLRGFPYSDYVIPVVDPNPPLSVQDVCDLSTTPYPATRHNLLIKIDSIDFAVSKCPTEILGHFHALGSCETNIDVCSDKTQVVVKNTTCSPHLLFSGATFEECAAPSYATGQIDFLCPFACTFSPRLLGSWISNRKGDLTISNHTLSGFEPYGDNCTTCTSQTTDYECYMQSGTIYLIRSARTFMGNDSVRIYVCLNLTEVSGTKYIYYQAHSSKNVELGDYLSTLNSAVPIDDMNDVCQNWPVKGYDPALFSVLIRTDSIDSSMSSCPEQLHSLYNTRNPFCDYTLSTCQNTMQIKLSDTTCNPTPFYTGNCGGLVSCLHTVRDGAMSYVTLYNLDATVDNVSNYRFSCFVFHVSGTKLMFTQNPEGCQAGQNSTYINSAKALAFQFEYQGACPSGDEFNWVILFAVIGAVIVLIVVAMIIWYLCYRQCDKRRREKINRYDEENILASDEEVERNANGENIIPSDKEIGNKNNDKIRSGTEEEGEGSEDRKSYRKEGKGRDDDKRSTSSLGGGLEDLFSTEGEIVAIIRNEEETCNKKTEGGMKDGEKRRDRSEPEEQIPIDTSNDDECAEEEEEDEDGGSSCSKYNYSEDFSSGEYSQSDNVDSRSNQSHKNNQFGSRYNVHASMAWTLRKNKTNLIKDKTPARSRKKLEHHIWKNLNKNIPAGKRHLAKEMLDKAAWQRKNKTFKRRVLRNKRNSVFPWSEKYLEHQRMHNTYPPGFQLTPFVAQYYTYTNHRNQLRDEGFWDSGGNPNTTEERFEFIDLEDQFEMKNDALEQRQGGSRMDVEQGGAEAIEEKGRFQSEKRIVINFLPTVTIPVFEDTESENQTSREFTQAEIPGKMAGTNEATKKATVLSSDLMSRLYPRLKELKDTNQKERKRTSENGGVLARIKDRQSIKTAFRRLLAERLFSTRTGSKRSKPDSTTGNSNRYSANSKLFSLRKLELSSKGLISDRSSHGQDWEPTTKDFSVLCDQNEGGEFQRRATEKESQSPAIFTSIQSYRTATDPGGSSKLNSLHSERPEKEKERISSYNYRHHSPGPLKTGQFFHLHRSSLFPKSETDMQHSQLLEGLKRDNAFLQKARIKQGLREERLMSLCGEEKHQEGHGMWRRYRANMTWTYNINGGTLPCCGQSTSDAAAFQKKSKFQTLDDMNLRKLLEELYPDKKFMDKLINTTEQCETEKAVCAQLETGRDYLLQRALATKGTSTSTTSFDRLRLKTVKN